MTTSLPSQPRNLFLDGLRTRAATQYGLWCSLASPITTEICAGAGFDWLLLDMEHAPNELRDIYSQLQASSAYPSTCVVRPESNDPVRIKRLLDIGATSLLIPFVQSADEAQAAVRATRYPPDGIRGVTMSSRANRFGRDAEYLNRISGELCVIAQIETRQGLNAIEEIASVEGIDALFIGPSDLSADFGFLGEPGAAEPRAAIDEAIRRLNQLAKPWGILAPVAEVAHSYAKSGAAFIAIGSDQSILTKAVDSLASRFIQ